MRRIKRLQRFSQTLTKETQILVEATVNTFAFVARFQKLVAQVVITNTHKLKIISFTEKKPTASTLKSSPGS